MTEQAQMKKCIIIPDSFKGTMTSIEVCDIMAKAVLRRFPGCEVVAIPVADGGEGTVDCFLRAKAGQPGTADTEAGQPGERVTVRVQDAYGGEIDGFYGRFGDVAVVEMAAVAGMVSNTRRETLDASTYGVGQLMAHAIASGAGTILLGLGGSCTSDAGCGMACALGARFTDAEGRAFIPTGRTLNHVKNIDITNIMTTLSSATICCMCDTDKVMYGPDGAAFVYAPQKGASEEEVRLLDDNLRSFAGLIKDQLGVDVSEMPGGGAAGAMGAGAFALLGAELKPGIEYIMDLVGFDECLEGADCVFTGEGSFDMQSLSGKAVCGISARAAEHGVPVIVVAGRSRIDGQESGGASKLADCGITAIYETARTDDWEEIKRTCREDLARTMDEILAAMP